MKDNQRISLYLNTATKALEVGAKKGTQTHCLDLGNPKMALEMTHEGIAKLGQELGFDLADVDDFYCLLGPGSNTGIRLGLTIPRTIYALNPNIRLYGIKTMELFLFSGPKAALSDRNGNLFVAEKKGTEITCERVDKENIPSLPSSWPIVIEEKDSMAKEELASHDLIPIDVLQEMMNHSQAFEDYSAKEEDFLPEYVLKI